MLVGPLAPACADPGLAYRCEPGSVVRMVVENDFQLPIIGAQPNRLEITTNVLTADASGSRNRQTVLRKAPGKADRAVDVRMAISREGLVSGVEPIPQDAEGAFLARTTLLLLPALPNRAVGPGDSWTVERTLPLPPMPISAPPEVRVNATVRVLSYMRVDGQRRVNLSLDAVQAPGEKVKLGYTGTVSVDEATGRPMSGSLTGRAALPLGMFLPDAKATFTIRLVSTFVDRPNARRPLLAENRYALLGLDALLP
jgi:hypothetical protein